MNDAYGRLPGSGIEESQQTPSFEFSERVQMFKTGKRNTGTQL